MTSPDQRQRIPAPPPRAPQLQRPAQLRPNSTSEVGGGAVSNPLLKYRRLIVIGLMVILFWEVATRSLVAYLADTAPNTASWLRATPTVLLNLADDKLNADAATKVVEPVLSYAIDHASQERSYAKGIQSIERLDASKPHNDTEPKTNYPSAKAHSSDELSDADYAQVSAWANQALRNDPLNARALRILAQIAEHSADDARTAALMRGAAQRSLEESLAVFWMMRESYLRKNFAEAIRYADILLRTRPQLGKHVFPMLGRIAEEPTAKADLKQVLAKNPPWRGSFFDALPRNVTDARTPAEVLLNLRDTSAPPTDAELKSYLEALVQGGFYELAYYSWLQFLPPEQLAKTGRLFNGSFETAPSGLPFDWVYTKGAGVNIKFAQRPDRKGQHALLIEFGPGRVDFDSGLSELVLLPAGTYRLRGKYKPDLVSQRGLRWTVRCAKGKEPIGESAPMNGSGPSWKDIDFSFTVPSSDCQAQHVALILDSRSASEKFVSGAIWYDNLSITRAPNTTSSSSEPVVP